MPKGLWAPFPLHCNRLLCLMHPPLAATSCFQFWNTLVKSVQGRQTPNACAQGPQKVLIQQCLQGRTGWQKAIGPKSGSGLSCQVGIWAWVQMCWPISSQQVGLPEERNFMNGTATDTLFIYFFISLFGTFISRLFSSIGALGGLRHRSRVIQ